MTQMPNSGSGTSFFGKLFDFSFETAVTTSVVKVLYILLLIVISIGSVVFLISSLAAGGGAAVAGLILTPVLFFVYLLLARIYLELILVLFRVEANTKEIADLLRQQRP